MIDEAHLRDKLRKIEALFAGPATAAEPQAADAAAELRLQLAAAISTEPEIDMRFSIANPWSRRLFIALCRRYGLKPFRYARMKRQCRRQSAAYLSRAHALARVRRNRHRADIAP